jgi:glycosyltransferase involved in cell wall biosynthesis
MYAAKLRKIIFKRQIEIVQGHQAVDALHLWMAIRRRRGVKSVLTVDVIPDAKNQLATGFIVPRMDAVVFPSRALRDQVRTNSRVDAPLTGVVIPNAADPLRMQRVESTLRQELGIDESVIVLGMIGNFYRNRRKDQVTVLRALPEVLARFPNAHCIFAGGTEAGAEGKLQHCKDICREYGISERVHFLGSRSDIPNVLAGLDLFVFSSFHEGAPVAVLEAIFAKVPVLASDIAPHREYAKAGPLLELFKTGDAADLSKKMIEMLSDRRSLSTRAANAYESALKTFSIDARLGGFNKLYQRLLSS